MTNLKEVVKAMCKAYPGGREAMAGALGMSLTQFNNNLYEKNGCRFFEVSELEAMEDISNTSLLADHFARRRGALLVDVPHLEELDRVDLFSRAMRKPGILDDIRYPLTVGLQRRPHTDYPGAVLVDDYQRFGTCDTGSVSA